MTRASDGTIREQYDYDAFGYPYFYSASGGKLASGFQFGNRFLFTGREWLKDLRVYDYRNRIYQPELGRFLQPDPTGFEGGDYNLYRYCHNDPVNRSDPTGLVQITASTWNNQIWLRGGTFMSMRAFDLLKQGKAWIMPPTGNFRDKKVENHFPKNNEISKRNAGETHYDARNVQEIAGLLIIKPTLNWYVWPKYKDADVVKRELEHVSRWLYWQGKDGDGSAAVSDFNRNKKGIGNLRATMTEAIGWEGIYQESNIHKSGRHDITSSPAKRMDPAEIEKLIENVGPRETPWLGN